jgi:hypothetical protein
MSSMSSRGLVQCCSTIGRTWMHGRSHLVVQSSSIHIDKSNAVKLSKYDQQWFKSFTNKTTQLNGDEHVNVLLENNRNWARSKNEEDPEFFKKLGDSPPCCE